MVMACIVVACIVVACIDMATGTWHRYATTVSLPVSLYAVDA